MKPYALNKNKYLLDHELDQLRQTTEKCMTKDTRNCLLIQLALHTGARASELLAITLDDINPYDKSVFIRGIKNSNDREIPLPATLFEQLYAFAKGRKKIFDISYQRLDQVWGLYRPVNKKFHSLRHTFAINLYKKTKDLRLVQVALGHRNITNTMIYADYVYSQTELKKLIL